MNRRVKAPLDFHKEMKTDDERGKLQKSIMNKRLSQKERRSALLQDVDKLKKKLSHEESVHKALERAMNRPLGALPRLPPFLPPHTLELLAEVAVLEEEVVRLEQEVMSYRQGLYNAAVNTASKKIPDLIVLPKQLVNRQEEPQTISCDERNTGLQTTLLSASLVRSASSRRLMSSNPIFDQGGNCLIAQASEKTDTNEFSSVLDDGRGKENKLCTNCVEEKTTTMKIPTKRPPRPQMIIKNNDPPKSQSACRLVDREQAQESSPSSSEGGVVEQAQDSIPNKLSEDILNCLCIIFLRLSAAKDKSGRSKAISSIFPFSNENDHKEELRDPYFSGSEIKKKDIGPYKHLYSIEARSIDLKRKTNALFLISRLKILLGKLASVSLEGLTHQQKLAFWINTYNSCMMNAFLEKGIPEAPEMVVELLQKATIMVGGNLLNAVTIEHFILRLPNRFKYPYSQKVAKNVHIRAHKVFGLEWSEPLITFALSCGSRSSPAVRVYSASQVENQLEAAKKDYLQAAVSISVSNKIIIPKLLDWYLLDFAKDLGALLDWVCLQLPNELRNEAIKIVESIKGTKTLSESINIFLHDFSFRYLIHR